LLPKAGVAALTVIGTTPIHRRLVSVLANQKDDLVRLLEHLVAADLEDLNDTKAT
jgi:hypothetical protein